MHICIWLYERPDPDLLQCLHRYQSSTRFRVSLVVYCARQGGADLLCLKTANLPAKSAGIFRGGVNIMLVAICLVG
jgi:hypothetical protein